MAKLTLEEKKIITQAKNILAKHFKVTEDFAFTSPCEVKTYLQAYYSNCMSREHFDILYVCSQHKLIKHENLFKGTIDACSVYPRVIIEGIIKNNAAAVILVHNHPSGIVTPSNADKAITQKIKTVVEQIDCKLLDHFIVGESVLSFAERGLI